MKKAVFIILTGFAGAVILWAVYVNASARRLPDNRPAEFLKAHPEGVQEKVVVCAGDSITHGKVSCSYVDVLDRRLAGYEYLMVNAGINGEFSWNLLQRVDEIIKCNPSCITILIGTNDADATLYEEKLKRGMKEFRLPERPSKKWFRENIDALCKVLKSQTRARIALLSLPPIGESEHDRAFVRAAEFSGIVKEVAAARKLAYLPLNETMTLYLKKNPPSPKYGYERLEYIMYRGIIEHHGFGVSYDRISKRNGFVLITDFLHLNCTAAGMVADLIERFVKEE